jgi:E3 ubiquitin-protein ligase TRIP12
VGYQETIFSCFYRKAVGLGLGSVLSEFEDALMISGIPHEGAATSPQQANNSMSAQNSQADLVGTPVRDSPPATATVPDNADSSPTAIASAASGALFPPDTPMTRQRAYYFHVFPPNSTSKCCCGDIVAPSANARSTDADDDAASQATKYNEAARNLANELPTSVSFRPPELTSTARFTLLRILYTVCVAPAVDRDHTILRLTAPVIPAQAFVCHELGVRAVKAAAASALRVAVMPPQFALPQWLVEVLYHAPYLLAPAVQQQLLHFLVVGARRSLAEAVQSHSLFSSPTAGCAVAPAEWGPSSNNTFVNRPPPKEVVKRDDHIFEAEATKILRNSSERRGTLMFEFEGDKGTGQGPTMQFFTKVAEHLSREGRGLWRGDLRSVTTPAGEKKVTHVKVPAEGLYPAPGQLQSGQDDAFYLCGSACGRALLDGRVFPLPLSPTMFAVLKRRVGLHRRARADDSGSRDSELEYVDRGFAQSLAVLQNFAQRHERGENVAADIAALELSFTLPGAEEFELIPDGANTLVNAESLPKYLSLVKAAVLEDSVSDALDHFCRGFSDVAPMDALLAMDATTCCSLVTGIGGEEGSALWTADDLQRSVTGDHGYSKDSRELKWLREILAEMSPQQQRAFLHFATGCPRLPVGGLAALGTITVVKKDATDLNSLGLPSVNTCFRYIKLPPYASKAEMKSHLLLAVTEAGDGFDLS